MGRRNRLATMIASGRITVVTAIVGALTGGTLAILAVEQRVERAEARALRAFAASQDFADALTAELDRRTTARDATDAAQERRIREAVCVVLPDLPSPSEDVQRLADALGCPVDTMTPGTQPLPGPAAIGPGAASPGRSASPQSRPAPQTPAMSPRTAEPRPAPSPARSPRPSPTPPPSPPPQPPPAPPPPPSPGVLCPPVCPPPLPPLPL